MNSNYKTEIRELLILLRNHLINCDKDSGDPMLTWYASDAGLCLMSLRLCELKKISVHEHHLLQVYIKNNRPSIFSKHYSWRRIFYMIVGRSKVLGYYWPPYEWLPRLLWLEDQIAKLNVGNPS